MNMTYAKGSRKAESNASVTLKEFWADSGRTTTVLMHNGVISICWGMLLLLVAYVALQAALIGVAVVLGQTGGVLMETTADVITVYVVIAMVCGFDLFFAFLIEKRILKAIGRRFWKVDHKNKCVDKGDLWKERHLD